MALKTDRVVLVTGASRGVGKGTAVALGATGARTVNARANQHCDCPQIGNRKKRRQDCCVKSG